MKTKAKKIYYYWRMYQHFLIDNNLSDDSEDITVEELVNFVENNITEEERTTLYKFVLNTY